MVHGAELTVTGQGFGNRSSDSPVLFDQGEITYENGSANAFNEGLDDMALVPTTEDDPTAIWAKATNIDDSDAAYLKKSGDMRHDHSQAHYFLTGEDAWVGLPKAYGGQNGWDMPTGNPKLYVAWWIKAKYNPDAYYRATPLNQSGQFIEGESVQTGSGISGRYIGTDPEGLLNFEFVDFGSTASLKNELIEGQESGATTTFPDKFRAGSGPGYETPGSQKYLRVWDEASGQEGIRFSWTQRHQTISDRNTGSSIVNGQATPLVPEEWHLFELEMDTAAGRVQTFVNGQPMKRITYPEDTAATELGSPTIALLGLNGKVGKFQETTVDDIYMDTQFNRVVIGNAKQFANVTHYEIQNYSSWSDESIRVKANLGSLDPNQDLHLFVDNPEGEFNEQGLSLAPLQESPPAKTGLTVE